MKWKKTVRIAVVVAMVGLYGRALAGPVLSGGGGEGVSFRNDSLTSGNAWWNQRGEFVITDMFANFFLNHNPDPVPSNLGYFTYSVQANGYWTNGEKIVGDDYARWLIDHPFRSFNDWRVNQVTVEERDGFQWIMFNPSLELNGQNNASLFWNPESDKQTIFGNASGNLSVQGGAITGVSSWFNDNRWAGEGERPTWINEVEMGFSANGIITASDFAVVPEPATLTLAALGAASSFCRRRRFLSLND